MRYFYSPRRHPDRCPGHYWSTRGGRARAKPNQSRAWRK